jgi:hypothetical protein
MRADKTFDVAASEAALAAKFQRQPIVEVLTARKRPFFLRRNLEAGTVLMKVYRVFSSETAAMSGKGAVGSCWLCGPIEGIASIVFAEVEKAFQRKGIAAAVYDQIAADVESVGALFWPISPVRMGDAEFKVWWRRSPALVFYYPHRERLGFQRRPEYEALLNETRQKDAAAVAKAWAAKSQLPKMMVAAQRLVRKKLAMAAKKL